MEVVDEREKKKKKETNKQTNKDRKEQGRREAIVKGWELNDFVVHLSEDFFNQYVKLF